MGYFLISSEIYGSTDQPTDGRTDTPSYRDVWTDLKIFDNKSQNKNCHKKNTEPNKNKTNQKIENSTEDMFTLR